ncbi:hypothetical protein Kpol_1051p30 [Vanderwaltozyma polyspora DSM 70294]|uniref:Deoxycytidylate deaminase n=1 Tax=Vanderwaltozyma polyspora (strain ATCC 22028 / DSM 70294 / BCRC 21397 / CBS 2163 / NBRC 10782 / NRRL Y-8283 / UCD 57-17) TaxID=436907 RepID=A7TMZ3_VANPO|nr:uncharacterized protein Kpol_1051p30 [Vanderwaltozyma polyspora DSM 70294]EDO16381.1 hypothetical protein Kpol_1051p30 [Vanderwaltozyma polyspora DSM 70294]
MLVAVSGTKFSGLELAIEGLVKDHGFQLIDKDKNEDEILDYATKNYTKNLVVELEKLSLLEKLEKRPFFVHLSLDASINLRLNLQKLNPKFKENDGIDLSDILKAIDECDYENESVLVRERANFKFKIITKDLSDIKNRLIKSIAEQLQMLQNQSSSNELSPPLRPDWDTYFMKLATLAASRSNCMKRRVGCVIVRDRRVIATGYNGTPRHLTNCFNGGCPRCNDGNSHTLHTCLCLHAEENALLEAGRDRIGQNAILYCDTCPCLTCSVKIVQTGIKEVVYSQSYRMDEDSFKVLKEGGVNIRQFNFLQDPRIILI